MLLSSGDAGHAQYELPVYCWVCSVSFRRVSCVVIISDTVSCLTERMLLILALSLHFFSTLVSLFAYVHVCFRPSDLSFACLVPTVGK